MWVSAVSLIDFRSYPEADVTLEPGVSTFVGPNGEGKTNLLEALVYTATLRSHRVATDAPLVRHGRDQAVIRTRLVRDRRPSTVEIEINPGRANRARVNGAAPGRAREALGVLRTVLFSPEDLSLVKGDPAARRDFLDDLLVLRAPRLAGVRADYDRVLRQRNALLKSAGAVRGGGAGRLHDTLDVWDHHLARSAAELLVARARLTTELTPRVVAAYRAVAPGGAEVGVTYRASLGADAPADAGPEVVEAALLADLAGRRRADLDRGMTLAGPHRDDLLLHLGDLPARGYASQGESWSLALALRMASYEMLMDDGGEPVLLLDDVFAELDAERRARLADVAAGSEQVLVTAAVPGDVPEKLDGARFDVMGGDVRRIR